MEVLFNFRGEINNQVLRSILSTMEAKMEQLGEERFMRKKINQILIECLQNLIFHAEKPASPDEAPGLYIARDDGNRYSIHTSNLVTPEKADSLRKYVERINNMNPDELRDYYQEVLTNGKFNPQGGAGLGIINIARVARKSSDEKLTYAFTPASNQNLMFEMRIRV